MVKVSLDESAAGGELGRLWSDIAGQLGPKEGGTELPGDWLRSPERHQHGSSAPREPLCGVPAACRPSRCPQMGQEVLGS